MNREVTILNIHFKKTKILLFHIFLFVILTNCSLMSRELKPEERSLVQDSKALKEHIKAKGWTFNDQVFRRVKMSGVTLKNTTIKNINFIKSVLSDFNLTNVTFENCTFIQTNFINSKFKNCRFYQCNFGCKFVQVDFGTQSYQCNPDSGVGLGQNVFKNNNYSDVKFIKSHFYKTSFQDSNFNHCSFEESHFNKDSFFWDNVFVNVSVLRNEIDGLSFSVKSSKNLQVIDNNINGFHNTGNYEKTLIKDCHGKGPLSFFGEKIKDLKLLNCNINNIGISAKNNWEIVISNCKIFDLLTGLNKNIENFMITNSIIITLNFYKSVFNGNNRISNTIIRGFDLREAKLKGFTFENVTFDYYIALEKAIITKMKLINIKYAGSMGPLKLYNKNVIYKDSHRFPVKGAVIKTIEAE